MLGSRALPDGSPEALEARAVEKPVLRDCCEATIELAPRAEALDARAVLLAGPGAGEDGPDGGGKSPRSGSGFLGSRPPEGLGDGVLVA